MHARQCTTLPTTPHGAYTQPSTPHGAYTQPSALGLAAMLVLLLSDPTRHCLFVRKG